MVHASPNFHRRRKYEALREQYEKDGRKDEFISGLRAFANTLSKADDEVLQVFVIGKLTHIRGELDIAIGTYERAWEAGSTSRDLDCLAPACWALYNKALALDEQKDYAEALKAYDAVFGHFAEAEEIELNLWGGHAQLNKAIILGEQKCFVEGRKACDQVLELFGQSKEIEHEPLVAKSLDNKGILLAEEKQYEAAIASYDEVVDLFESSEEFEVKVEVARAMLNKGCAFQELGENQRAIAAYDWVAERFLQSGYPVLEKMVAGSQVNKGALFLKQENYEAALIVCQDVISRFGKRENLELDRELALAFNNCAVALGKMGKPHEAADYYEEIVATFQGAEDEVVCLLLKQAKARRAIRHAHVRAMVWCLRQYRKFIDAITRSVTGFFGG